MVATKSDAYSMIDTMTESDFTKLCAFLNTAFEKNAKRKAAEERFISEVRAAEESVANGNYVTLEQLHENLGV
ncbi:MAG: hypothetical protein K6A69_04615 [Lachnospiraceae bacterium]|nr:hypothetical protein [Lachnospiraceae bacterium]